jgi:hypothetical protein
MQTKTQVDASAPLARRSLEELPDGELLEVTRRLVGRSNHLLAELLVHLGEVEARGIHRTRACSSLYAYCIYELRFSEDEAFRRVAAARLIRRFPALLDALASGELHLTGLLMLGPHLTESNLLEVLTRAKHRTKRELARLVRILDPLPAVPARIEPLGPAPARLVPSEPTWQEFIDSTCPVRELLPGDRPREWTESANDGVPGSEEHARKTVGRSAGAGTSRSGSASGRAGAGAGEGMGMDAPDHREDTTVTAQARVESAALKRLEPERYKVQFTATEEYVRLVEEAKALLSHAVPNVTLEELQMRAMHALVAELKKKKYAAGSSPGDEQHAPHEQPHPRQRVRHIPAAVRRAVFERDGTRCTYLDGSGARCRETHRLEFHHLKPFATGGDHRAANLTLRCAAHNALAAEEDFGRELVEHRKAARQHESFESVRG